MARDRIYNRVPPGHFGEDFDMDAAAGWRDKHPGNRGWARIVTIAPAQREPVRLFDEEFEYQGTVALATNSSAISLVQLAVTRGSARVLRKIVVPPWSIAIPIAGGTVVCDAITVQNKGALAPAQVSINGSFAYGIGYEETYSDQSEVVAGVTPLTPPDFARTVTLTVLQGTLVSIDGFPVGLVAGQSITLPAGNVDLTPGAESAVPHVLVGGVIAPCVVSVLWKVISP